MDVRLADGGMNGRRHLILELGYHFLLPKAALALGLEDAPAAL
jgi:hypothetical protein